MKKIILILCFFTTFIGFSQLMNPPALTKNYVQTDAANIPAVLVNPTNPLFPELGDQTIHKYNNGHVISIFDGINWVNNSFYNNTPVLKSKVRSTGITTQTFANTGNVVVNFPTVEENGIQYNATTSTWTLDAGSTYELHGHIGSTGATGARCTFQFRNITNNLEIGTPGSRFSTSDAASSTNSQTDAFDYSYTPAATVQVQLWVLSCNNAGAFFGGGAIDKLNDFNSAYIEKKSIASNYNQPVISNYVGANGTSAGIAGLVPSAIIGQQNSLLKGDGTWIPNTGLQAIGNNVSIGTTGSTSRLNIGLQTVAATATPDDIDLGGTYSTVPFSNLKIKTFHNAANNYGIGVSQDQFDLSVPATARFAWGIGGVERMRLNTFGFLGLGTTNQTSTLEVVGSQANIPTIITSATTISNICYLQSQGLTTYLVTMPVASSCAGRRYVIKNTGIAKTITAYNDNAGVSTTILPLGITILVSSAGVWEKFNN